MTHLCGGHIFINFNTSARALRRCRRKISHCWHLHGTECSATLIFRNSSRLLLAYKSRALKCCMSKAIWIPLRVLCCTTQEACMAAKWTLTAASTMTEMCLSHTSDLSHFCSTWESESSGLIPGEGREAGQCKPLWAAQWSRFVWCHKSPVAKTQENY